MTRNVGGADRAVRLIVGSLLVAVPIVVELPGWWGLLPFVIGVVLVLTGAFRYCPVNRLLGVDSSR